MSKKFPIRVMLIIGILSMIFINHAYASDYDFKQDNLYYNILSEEDRTVEVTYSYRSSYYDNPFEYNYNGLENANIPDKVISSGKTYVVVAIGLDSFHGCKSLKSVTIPNSVTTIGFSAFCDCSSLESVTIPKAVTSVGFRAFSSCSKLGSIDVDSENLNYASHDGVLYNKDKSILLCCPGAKVNVNLPASVTTIENEAFYDCDALTSVTIPDSVTTIGVKAFYDCDALTSATIGDSVTTIGEEAFYRCRSLASVTIGDSVTTIGDGAFYRCRSLASVTMGDSVTTIGKKAFYVCDALASVTIPESVTTIGEEAFYYCDALASVTIPESITTIGNSAFRYCTALKYIYNLSNTPLKCNPNFTDYVRRYATLYVPTGTLEAYQKVDPWRNFWNIEETDFSDIEDITINEKSGYNVYNLQGVQVLRTDNPEMINTLPAGIYIVNGKKMVVK